MFIQRKESKLELQTCCLTSSRRVSFSSFNLGVVVGVKQSVSACCLPIEVTLVISKQVRLCLFTGHLRWLSLTFLRELHTKTVWAIPRSLTFSGELNIKTDQIPSSHAHGRALPTFKPF